MDEDNRWIEERFFQNASEDPQILRATLVTLLKTSADRAAIPPEVAARLVGKAA